MDEGVARRAPDKGRDEQGPERLSQPEGDHRRAIGQGAEGSQGAAADIVGGGLKDDPDHAAQAQRRQDKSALGVG
jgi:hypothetical protein